MKTLSSLLGNTCYCEIAGDPQVNIETIVFDSRKVHRSENENVTTLYVAQRGTQTDGHLYIPQAVEAGAGAVLCEEFPATLSEKVCYVRVKDSSVALGQIADAFFDHPSRKLKLVGITGTNGKTTTVTLLHRLFMSLGYKAGLLSTIVNRIGDEEVPATHTTPDALELNALLSRMVEAGCEYCFMEVSSHSVCQHRIEGLVFAGGIFSNITHDHLDFHKTFANYIRAKKGFFDALPASAFALTNLDDKNGMVMVQNTRASVKTYSLQSPADFKTRLIENSFEGLHLEINGVESYFRLSGRFNAYNLTAIYAAAVLLGIPSDEVLVKMSALGTADGRFEVIRNGQGGVAIVDYAHTPDALKNVLSTIRNITRKGEEVLTVVGCGGNRDKTKRPEMAAIACEYSDCVILTSDNPRFEEPAQILRDMEPGIPAGYRSNTLIIENRREAIRTACMLMRDHGVILIAGKGHEKYQDVQGTKHHFDDIEEVRNDWEMGN